MFWPAVAAVCLAVDVAAVCLAVDVTAVCLATVNRSVLVLAGCGSGGI